MSKLMLVFKNKAVFRILALGLLLVCANVYADLPSGIAMSVDVVQSKVSPSEQALVKVTYTNVGSTPKQLLRWETAFEGRVDEDFLTVTHEGRVLPYMGRHYKRAPATSADYISLAPGESRSQVVDINTGYHLDYKGEYLISPKGAAVAQKSPPVKLILSKDRPVSLKQTPIINSCDGDRPDQIDSALGAAESLAKRARDDMRATPVAFRRSVQRYKEWFGAYTATRWNAVQRNFDRIFSTLSGRTITFECDDSVPYFAYVYPGQPYDVYLGQAFWSAPMTGTDSKAGTIIHEVSHFNVVAATDDIEYGQSAARSLARTRPADAVRNADSHEYFAENTPSLPMFTATVDLVSSITVTEDLKTVVGGNVSLSASVSNVGSADAPSTTVTVRVSADSVISLADPVAGSAPVMALAGGEELAVDLSFKAPREEGQYWIGVCVTEVNGESGTDNNCSGGVPLTVRKMSLLSVLMLLLSDDD
ncbi:hypothetical protein GCM10008090_04960 [Arenicella chitinivorans]|uniref:Lysine-specific metallo-endopeptidase domain-containing protein n=1 Tax=Arenicella chitinivorans TaxID=1329800 RepID=A0A918RK02_9GAMM|nr:M35 family metallo-endopeptidase [Arenicella chitinivorans]GGZ99383.1 hypothetical protein GCM10008090_04960 [Arenicella chitinivorans]